MKNWAISLCLIKDADEKSSAYAGFVKVASQSYQAVAGAFPFVCHSLVNYRQSSPEMTAAMG